MVNIDNFILTTDCNSFKSNGVTKGNLIIPTSIDAGTKYTYDVIVPINDDNSSPHFSNVFVYATDYADNFDYFPAIGVYRDRWNDARSLSSGVTILSSAGLLNGYIIVKSTNNSIYVTLSISRIGMSAVTITHPTYLMPVSIVDYNLSN